MGTYLKQAMLKYGIPDRSAELEEEQRKLQQAQTWNDTMASRASRKETSGVDPALAKLPGMPIRGLSNFKQLQDVQNADIATKAEQYHKDNPNFLNPYIPDQANELLKRKQSYYFTPQTGDSALTSFGKKLFNEQQQVRLMDTPEYLQDISTGNKAADAAANLLGFGAGLINPEGGAGAITSGGGTALKLGKTALTPIMPKLAGLGGKGALGRTSSRAIQGAVSGAGYGAAEGIVQGKNAQETLKNAGEQAAMFGGAEAGFGAAGDLLKRPAKDIAKYGSEFINAPKAGELLRPDTLPRVTPSLPGIINVQIKEAAPEHTGYGQFLGDAADNDLPVALKYAPQTPALPGSNPPALPAPSKPNWEAGTGKIDPEYQTRQLAKMQKNTVNKIQAEELGLPPEQAVNLKRSPQAPEVDELNMAMGNRIGADKVEHAPEAMQRKDMQAADTIAKLLGADGVTPVRNTSNQGIAMGRRVFLNEKNRDPVMYLVKHEAYHTIEDTNPELYAELVNDVRSFATDESSIVKHYTDQGYKPDDVWSEFHSDIMSELGDRPDFWAKMRETSPQVVQKVIDVLDSLIAKFKQAVGTDQSMTKYIRDIEALRDVVAPKVGKHLENVQGGNLQAAGEGIAAKQNMAFKLGNPTENRTVADDIKDMVSYGTELARNGSKADFGKAMRQQFADKFSGYSPEMQEKLINNLFIDSLKLAKEKKITLDVGRGNTISLDLPDLNGKNPRKLGLSAIKAPWAKEEYAQGVKAEITPDGRGAYEPISNEQTMADAQKALQDDPGSVVRRILSDAPADRVDNTAGLLLVKQANETGDIGLAVDLTESLAKKATEAGQAIQALSMWGRLTPEGMLAYGQKVVAKANYDLVKAGIKKPVKLNEEAAQKIVDLMKQAEGLEGRAKDIKVAQALDLIAAQVPPSTLQKISTLQTMAQLLNPKTAIRNIVGNTGFGVTENISDVVGAGLDKTVGLFTGNRSKVLPSLKTQVQGGAKGFKLGLEDALLGIDTSNMAGGKFDIPTNRTFRKGILGKAEKVLNIELRASDRAFYQAAYDESLRQQMAAAAKSKKPPTMELMEENARYDALYRTFQDDSVAAKIFTGLKRSLNFGKEFGIGDFVLKYPKTPANLLSRGIEYSPAGFIKTVMELGKPLFGKEFNQKSFVESTSRALVGSTLLVGTGALLHQVGIITGKPNDDRDVENLNAQAGFGQYRINVSALKRFIASGFDTSSAKLQKGDTTVSYDWFQPSSIGLAMGADIDQNKNQKKGIVNKIGSLFTLGASGLVTGINAFADQPVVQGIQQLFSGQSGDMASGIFNVLEGVPASFVPTLLNQVKQLIDNQKRSTYSPNYGEEMKNKAISKLPGMGSTLPKSHGTLGQPLETYQGGGNNMFNVLFNPSFVSKYNPTPEAEKTMDAFNRTGDQTIFPRTVPKYITFTQAGQKQSERIDLTSQEYSDYQRLTGQYAQSGISKLSTNATPAQYKKILDDAAEKAKKDILAGRGLKMK